MPRYPRPSGHAESIRRLTFFAFEDLMAHIKAEGRLVPFHLGDTYLMPPRQALEAVGLDDLSTHLYAPTRGLPDLVAALAGADRVGAERIWITPGATGGLTTAALATLEPGDEVLLLTPSWPLIFGILQSLGVKTVEVEVGNDGWPDEPDRLAARLEAALTRRTAGLYLCQPNNPAGFVYSTAHLEAFAELTRRHDLWWLLDEAYRDLVFDGTRPLDPRSLEGMDEHIVQVRSFSKSWALAGARVGYLVAPARLSSVLSRVNTHMTYHASVPGQNMALGALSAGEPYVERLRRAYREASARAARALEDLVRFRRPEAGYYLFLDLRDRCRDGEEMTGLLRRILETGVSLAPGAAFGSSWTRFARLCFTAVGPDRLDDGLERIASVLAAG